MRFTYGDWAASVADGYAVDTHMFSEDGKASSSRLAEDVECLIKGWTILLVKLCGMFLGLLALSGRLCQPIKLGKFFSAHETNNSELSEPLK